MNLTNEELSEINRGLLMRMDFLRRTKIDGDKRTRRDADRFGELANTARAKVLEEIGRRALVRSEEERTVVKVPMTQFHYGLPPFCPS